MGNLNKVYPEMIRKVMEAGQSIPSRNGNTKELMFATYSMDNIQQRLLSSRMISIPFALAEIVWVLTGRDDLDMIGFYARQVHQYHDDGKFNAAYGKRMRWGFQGRDQLLDAFKKLDNDHDSRHAVIIYSDPNGDYFEKQTRDRACNISSLFLIRDGKLHLTQTVRSHDAIWGLPYNYGVFTTIQDILARMLGVETGNINWVSNSFHIYEPHWQDARKIANQNFDIYDYFEPYDIGLRNIKYISLPKADLISIFIEYLHDMEEQIRLYGKSYNMNPSYGEYWGDVEKVFLSYQYWKHNDSETAFIVLEKIDGVLQPYLLKNYYDWRVRQTKDSDMLKSFNKTLSLVLDKVKYEHREIVRNWILEEE